jgi:hypothetical protein
MAREADKEVASVGMMLRGGTPVPTSAMDIPVKSNVFKSDHLGGCDFERTHTQALGTLVHFPLKEDSLRFALLTGPQLLIKWGEELII